MKRLVARNFGLKLLSLLFAVSLWLYVNLKASEQRELRLPVRWENMPALLEITNPVNDYVRVRVTGPRRILSDLDPLRFPITLDLVDAKEGMGQYQITDKMIQMPPMLKASVLPPDTIQFKFDGIITLEVPVKPRLVGKVAEGYAVEGIEAIPKAILMVGARSEIQNLPQVETLPIDLDNRSENFQTRVKVDPGRMHVRPSRDMDQVEVRVFIREARLQRLLTGVPVSVRGAAAAAAVQPHEVEIMLEGPSAKVRAVRQEEVEAAVALSGQKEGTYTLPVQIRVPGDDVSGRANPEQVVVTVRGSKRRPK